jgi:DNA repair protein RecN (Recombination protein N)
MKRKYGKNIEEVMEYFEKSKLRYEEAIDSKNILDKLNKDLKALEKEYMMEASKLSDLRKKCAMEFEEKILNEFKDLNMANARMKVEFKKSEIMRRDGIDEVLFTISTNLGEPYKPVNKIASGGEISRIMLGIKTILKNKSGDRFIIYDEIDSGISGKTAEIIGVKMYNVSRNTQIISVTHLPQIAVMADTHIVVEKTTENGRTYSKIENADGDKKKNEIARLISGRNVSDITISNVEEMIKYSDTLKL